MIAIAICCNPSLLIADEPTTALDVTIQAQILRLLRDLQEQFAFSVILITHNLGDANADFLQAIADSLKGRFQGVVVLGGGSESSVTLIATVSAEFTAKVQAGKIIQQIAPIVGGKGGGKPDNARGGGKDASKLGEALAKARSLLG